MKRKLVEVRRWAPWLLALTTAACGGERAMSVETADDASDLAIPAEAPSDEVRRPHEGYDQPHPVSVQWDDSLTKPLTRASEGFQATLRNHTGQELDVVVRRGFGQVLARRLDRRVPRRYLLT